MKRDVQPMDRAWLVERALRYVARWESSAAGVARLLERKVHERCARTGESPEAALELVPGIVREVVERGYVDDRRFATQRFERLRRQGRSLAQIRMQLRRKGVSDAITLELTHEEEDPGAERRAAERLARRRRLGPHCPDPDRRHAQRQLHLAALARQGFSLEIAERVIDADPGADADAREPS